MKSSETEEGAEQETCQPQLDGQEAPQLDVKEASRSRSHIDKQGRDQKELQGENASLFADTGCQYNLTPPEMYIEKMERPVQAKRTLRAW